MARTLAPTTTTFVMLSFEGPDPYAKAGGLGVRVSELGTSLAEEGYPFNLLFVGDPIAVLRKMYGWTKPGGYIVIQDYYVRTINLHPRLEACAELLRVIIETCERSGQDMEFAFKLPAYFVPVERFDELVDYLQARIDRTVLGKRNRARGYSNYESFDESQFTQMAEAR